MEGRPGWYPWEAEGEEGVDRWWDGTSWTDQYQHRLCEACRSPLRPGATACASCGRRVGDQVSRAMLVYLLIPVAVIVFAILTTR